MTDTRGPWGHNFFKLTLDILKLRAKKNVLGVFNGSFLSNVVREGKSLFNFWLGYILKKKFGKPWSFMFGKFTFIKVYIFYSLKINNLFNETDFI